MRPTFRLIADGADITANIKDRLLSLSYKDEAELKSDRLSVRLDDRPRREDGTYVALPEIGATLELHLGYVETGTTAMGSFTVDEIKRSGPVAVLEIGAKAAGMDGPFRSQTSKSWTDATLGDIARTIAREHGFEAKIEQALGGVRIPHADQTNESPMAFLNRLAGQHDGIAKPANGMLVLAPKGTAKAVTGQDLPGVTVRPADLSTWSYSYSARKEAGQAGGKGGPAGGVQSAYWDKDEARMVTVQEGEPPYQNVRFASSNPGEAGAAAAATKNGKDREKAKFSAAATGNSKFMAEQRMTLSGFRPGIPTDWRVTSVEHRLDGNGYSCSIEAELFNERQADVAAKASGDAVRSKD